MQREKPKPKAHPAPFADREGDPQVHYCLVKRLYRKLDPYIQIAGWLAIAAPVIGSCGAYLLQAQAQAGEIAELVKFKTDTQAVLLPLVQEVHDIHDDVKAMRRVVAPTNVTNNYRGPKDD